MNLAVILLVGVVLFLLAYLFYGRWLVKTYGLKKDNPTPSHALYDSIDYVPAKASVLLGHHFSSIAGAGPIVGPIIAAVAFGWLPTLSWIILGAIFIGGVHDFSALVASIRHQGRSIADIAKDYLSPHTRRLFLAFVWLTLVYVLIVFIDLTATTFKQNGGIATSAFLYILFALTFGFSLYRLNMHLTIATVLFVALVFLGIFIGQRFPLKAEFLPSLFGDVKKTWSIVLIGYCLIASIMPVWILLQPRDYLCSYLLYVSVIVGFVGLLFGGYAINYPSFTYFHSPELGTLFPILFITVACGAISGFHSLVASGTSSKQIDKENHARPIGYGGMLIEGLVALIALSTVVMVTKGNPVLKQSPLQIYAAGMGRFFEVFGLSAKLGQSFGLLALSTFLLTTLDTATRIARYVFQEFFAIQQKNFRYLATVATLVLPVIFALITLHDSAGNPIPAWKIIWPVFGATNQLLAALTLLIIFVWLNRLKKKTLFISLPMVFMLIVTLTALFMLILRFQFTIVGIVALILFILALFLIYETIGVFLNRGKY
ncbi:carbon starvation protein A [candidate division KSB1 bacterium]|nr:MAG: carbon starvation protein A [candidate division KSB1 bacterium]